MTEGCDVMTQKKMLMHAYNETHHAKIIAFADWDVPAYYTSIIDEHTCVRTKVGIFDISHMGEIHVAGAQARAYLQYMVSNDLDRYEYGTAFYALLCNPEGGIVDDVFVYPVSHDEYFLIVNASNIEKDFDWMQKNCAFQDVTLVNRSDERSVIALQGPLSDRVATAMLGFDTTRILFHQFREVTFQGEQIIIAATGYTGERGFELVFPNHIGEAVWTALLQNGEDCGIQPIGFGARDTLRLEAGCPLYGHELSDTINPYEVNIGWVVRLNKEEDFIGKQVLASVKEQGVKRSLFGFEMIDRAVARDGYEVFYENVCVGVVTSGTYLPTTKKNIGMALLDNAAVFQGMVVEIAIRDKRYNARVVTLPFYKRK